MRLLFLILPVFLWMVPADAQSGQEKNSAGTEQGAAISYESSDLPIVVINTSDQFIPDDYRITAHMGVINNSGQRNYFTGAFNEYDGIISIEQRGSSSAWVSDKKSYSFETQNDTAGNLNIALLGLPEENDWILIGEFSDKTQIRNALAYELSRRAGRYAGRTRFCELVLNGDYRGIYMLTEKIKRDRNRVDIAELNPDELSGDDLTGGYIIRIDRPDEYWISPYKSPVGKRNILISYYDPKGEEMPDAQKQYIKNYVTGFENALYGTSFQDPVTGYKPYVNLLSFVDFFILSEVAKNIDAYRLSTFLHKDKDSNSGKITMGPLWDVNLGFGNANYYSGELTDGWVVESIDAGDEFQIPFWWSRLRQDSGFNDALRLRWTQLRNSVLSESSVNGIVDSFALCLDEAQVRNYERWPVLDEWIWPNAYVGGTYENEIGYMVSWIQDLIAWMDEQLNYPVLVHDGDSTVNSYAICAYPNPFTSSLNIRIFLFSEARVKVSLLNTLGEEVLATQADLPDGGHDLSLETENGITPLSAGIYLYRVVVNGNVIRSGKVIKK